MTDLTEIDAAATTDTSFLDSMIPFVTWTDVLLLVLVLVTAATVVAVRNLFAATMLAGIYSLLMALVWVNMAAMDVAFTEAAVGAGISTILYLGTLVHVGREEARPPRLHWPAFLVVLLTGAALVYGTLDMPGFGKPGNPVHTHVAPEYIQQTVQKVSPLAQVAERPAGESKFGHHVPNLVTAVLATYRGYDTMFEAAVIFTAGAGMIVILRRRRPDPGFGGRHGQT